MSEDKLFSHVASVRMVGTKATQDFLLGLIREKGYIEDESLDSLPLFYFRAEISNELLDSHFTHMSETTLQNYAADAERGVAFLRGHNWHELPIGYSLTGVLEDSPRKRVVSDFYTVPGSPETDDLIFRMRSGLVRDVSVGFHGGRAICDLCGQDFWDCRHFPGLKYEEKEGDTVRTLLATFTIEDAHLSEVSGVFDGSTPEAMVLKAQRAAKAGELTREQVSILEARYRTSLPTSRSFAPVKPERNNVMDEKQLARLKGILVEAGAITPEQRDAVDDEAVVEHVNKLTARTKSLEPLAEEGRQYREDLVKEALTEGVRAMGSDFDATIYEQTLRASPLPVIKRMRDDWKKTADKTLPAGRQSVDSVPDAPVAEEPANTRNVPFVPDTAYMV